MLTSSRFCHCWWLIRSCGAGRAEQGRAGLTLDDCSETIWGVGAGPGTPVHPVDTGWLQPVLQTWHLQAIQLSCYLAALFEANAHILQCMHRETSRQGLLMHVWEGQHKGAGRPLPPTLPPLPAPANPGAVRGTTIVTNQVRGRGRSGGR